ncbi:TPA: hypothetical protein ACXJR6_003699 [Klebsiella aerogenes]|uniref:hypothetical protein n=1 Tax=Klebsiella aerogenes TaxID=548 RepID=UPI0013D2E7FE|nr:hypothetical protein [Klebsiella aerogenes]EKW5210363.1 hypothetical protein [Klebsiella aerogenes]ELS4538563.1 hypothetical protein [Klebsiella aerogenes]EMB4312466.1 hypothetical protein [Klebsiella aerogenes]HBV6025697.1 hypothetical protein [Klebsiella aerogenes]HBZ0406577.1 hypothetical protein [Klebsiella aerogenes]
MTDITRLLASLKRRSARAKEFGHDVLFVKLKDIDALVEALETKEEQRANWFQMAQKLGDELDVTERHVAELESRPVAAEPFTCPRCGRTTTHPEGWHYCHKREG